MGRYGRPKGETTDILNLYLLQARRHRILSREEEVALSERVQKGDCAAWEELVRCNLRLVISITRQYVGRGLEVTDLIQEGNLGLMRAAWLFDATFDTRFSTYATWWIKQAIGRALSNKACPIRIPVHAADVERAVNSARNHLLSTTGREPSVEELSEFVGKSVTEVMNALTVRKSVISYDVAVGSEKDGSLADLLADEVEARTEDILMEGALKDSVYDLLETLPEREHYILERRYGLDGGRCATLDEIGKEMGITRERVRQMQSTALRRLRPRALETELKAFLELSYSPLLASNGVR